jgi:hypothetical protein
MEKIWSKNHIERILGALTSVNPEEQEEVLRSTIQDFYSLVSEGDTSLESINTFAIPKRDYRIAPVDPLTFLTSKKYLGLAEELYPKVGEEFVIMNSGDYVEVVLTGAIGTAKTTLAIWTTAYQVYLLACLRNPQQTFGIDRSSEILFVFQSLNATLAKQLNYDRFRSLIQTSPFFTEYFPFDNKINTECIFPNRIIVRPISGQETGAIGQNVYGGMIDEVNFMEVTEHSAKTADGGEYNQAVALYNSLSRRRKSRFMKKGKLPGVFCLVSSKRYPGQFTDIKAEEAEREIERTGTTSTYIYDKRTWDVLPESDFSGEWFPVFIGDLSRKPRILDDDDPLDREKNAKLIVDVPIEYYEEFRTDILNALRDIAGVSTLAQYPFIMDNDAVSKGFGTVQSCLTKDVVDFSESKLGIMRSKFLSPTEPRWVHIDLSMTGDATGVACGFVDKFVKVKAGDENFELLPNIVFDFMLRVIPPKGGEINYQKIRDLLYALREQGLNIKWISCDSFQSTDMMQLLRRKGYTTGMVSIDRNIEPYSFLKTAFYQHRVDAPTHKVAQKEIASLEIDQKKGKVDHPDNGSKDVADAVAGVIFGLTMRREIWALHKISPFEIAESIKVVAARMKDKMKQELPE